MRKGEATRAKMIEAASRLFEREGFAGAGLTAILEESAAPKGSLYFHFPGGKEELARAALEASGEELQAELESALRGAKSATSGVRRLVAALAARAEASGFEKSCPLAGVAGSSASAPEGVREAASAALAALELRLASFLVEHGATKGEAARRASLLLSALEGALLLSRVHRSREPLARLDKSLAELLGER